MSFTASEIPGGRLFLRCNDFPNLGSHFDHRVERSEPPFPIQQPSCRQCIDSEASNERTLPPFAIANDWPHNFLVNYQTFERFTVSIKAHSDGLDLVRSNFPKGLLEFHHRFHGRW